jgi:hypothetical protein
LNFEFLSLGQKFGDHGYSATKQSHQDNIKVLSACCGPKDTTTLAKRTPDAACLKKGAEI